MEELLKKLGIKKIEKWHNYSIFIKTTIYYFGFKHKRVDYCVSNTKCSYYFSKIVNGEHIVIYSGYSKEELESAMRKELCA